MAKSINQKLKIFYLRQLLLDNTDKTHYLTMVEIINQLDKMGVKAERKSIYSDIELLRELGLNIINHKRLGYAVVTRAFDVSDIELVNKALISIDAPESQKENILSNLKNTLSVHDIELLD